MHHLMAVDAEASLDKGEFGWPVVHKNHIGVAVLADLKCLTRSNRDHAHLNAGLFGEGRE